MLDEEQRAVVRHSGGPLLVLAGPGTGKTTTIVETAVHRIERRGIDPERLLVLTFSRKAAGELRERIVARLRRTTRSPLALTFHSYAYALLRREAALTGEPPPRLLSGPEQLLEVRRLLAGELEDGAEHWPEQLRPALTTRGFAEELRDFLLRAAERGFSGRDLARLGRRHRRMEWVAAGRFADRYAARFDVDPHPAFDYAELIRAAAALLTDSGVQGRERGAYDAVFVDEYQDTDPAQEHLLAKLAGDGRDLIAVGDPDQSIYGFRGADVRGITRFPQRFRTPDGAEAPVIALRTSRRTGAALLAASRRIAARLPAPAAASRHRDLLAVPDADLGELRVVTTGSASEEAAFVADTLRRAHLLDGVPWSRMAVLVRSAVRQLPPLRRALTAAGVPVAVAGDEVPLSTEPGVRPFIQLLRCALRTHTLDEAGAEELLTSPLGGTDALGVRRLRRALRGIDADGAPTGVLLVEALRDPRALLLLDPEVRAPAERIAGLLAVARDCALHTGSAEDVLWAIWQHSGLAERWLDASLAGGARGAAADRDLDAVVALFEAAARFTDRLPGAGPEVFLDDLAAQEIPGDTLAEQAPQGEAVRILTAHRAKGLEWDVVVVAGVQEGVWPDARMRGSLLGVTDLMEVADGALLDTGAAGSVGLASRLLDEERRLFYVAVTRARRRLVVTAVGGEDTDERPSRFLAELAPDGVQQAELNIRSRRLSLPALVADLRSAVTDPEQPEPLRRAAAAALARLARAGVRGAHPREWYALTTLSVDGPLTDGEIRVSPSHVDQFTKCELRWLLEAAVGVRGADIGRHVGAVMHAIAEIAGRRDAPGEAELAKRLDEIWDSLDFGGVWYARRQREAAGQMVSRLLSWLAENQRTLVAVEEPFEVRLGRLLIAGRVDRLERDAQGRAVVVDVKTGATKPSDDELERHPQLGVYQLAVLLGAFARYGLHEPGGAELLQLGKAAGSGATAKAQRQAEPAATDDPDWPARLVESVAAGMQGPVFTARAGDGCRICPVRSCCPVHDEGGRLEP